MADIPAAWKATASFSRCKKYRYSLTRDWGGEDGGGELVAFIGLNPSTATLRTNDPTVERCCRYARDWGYPRMVMLNLFGFRATDPRDMKACKEPVGRGNDRAIKEWTERATLTLCCWGNHGLHLERSAGVMPWLPAPHALVMTGHGQPGHPLYLRKDLKPQPLDRFGT